MPSIPAPPWFPQSIRVRDENKKQDGNPTISEFVAQLGKNAQLYKKVTDKLKEKLLFRYAKNYYAYSALRNSTADVTIPIDLSLEVGKLYDLRTTAGNIGTGFLSQVTHHVKTTGSQKSQGVAITSLRFTHVEFTGFSLPDKD